MSPPPQDFPDHFEATERGVRALIRRILFYAGLDVLEIELDTFSQPEEILELDERREAKKWGHEGLRPGSPESNEDVATSASQPSAAERIREPITLVATLCHEVAHAWRAVHGLATADRGIEERLTDLTTVYLGFGLLNFSAGRAWALSQKIPSGGT